MKTAWWFPNGAFEATSLVCSNYKPASILYCERGRSRRRSSALFSWDAQRRRAVAREIFRKGPYCSGWTSAPCDTPVSQPMDHSLCSYCVMDLPVLSDRGRHFADDVVLCTSVLQSFATRPRTSRRQTVSSSAPTEP
ncbi:hypothetical protein HPB50_023365 [Hyalomma asiaticum]|uniref:Uncharacterized protein n=1 Tax=Hyalomma asiaticum TaxID=266040 RepID=A0ACB7T1U9_HYAAI|nr:hypothetical protein HPB50_023365 [Hyalomma asiaticum]